MMQPAAGSRSVGTIENSGLATRDEQGLVMRQRAKDSRRACKKKPMLILILTTLNILIQIIAAHTLTVAAQTRVM